MNINKGWFLSRWRSITLGVVLIFIVVGTWVKGDEIWEYAIQEEKEKQKLLQLTIDQQDELILSLNDSLASQANKISAEKIYIDEYKDDYIREYNRRRKLEKAIDSILYARFSKHYLDSLAKHVKYK